MIVGSSQAKAPQFTTQNAQGAETNADSTPTGTLYVNGTANGATVTVTNVSTGLYKASFTTPAGLSDYDLLELFISATIGGTAAKGKVWSATVLNQTPAAALTAYDPPTKAEMDAAIGALDGVIGTADNDDESTNITCKVGETGRTRSVTCTNADGTNRDLTAWGDKILVIERANSRTDVQVVSNADITISGADNHVFTFQPSATVLADKADFKWSLREESTGYVIIDGRLTVSYSPLEDEA